MTYIIYDAKINCPLRLDKFVRDLDIIITAEPVMSAHSATEFDTIEDANVFLQDLTNSNTYDTSECKVISQKDILKTEDDNNAEYERKQQIKAWNNTDTETKRSILRKMFKAKGQTEVDDWLKRMEDTSGITPMTDDEFIDRKVNEIESKYGIKITDDQRIQLFDKFVKGD